MVSRASAAEIINGLSVSAWPKHANMKNYVDKSFLVLTEICLSHFV